MDIDAFEARWHELQTLEDDIHTAKRRRYTGGRDPLENYRTTATALEMMGLPTGLGAVPPMLARLWEKLQRVSTMIGQDDFHDLRQGDEMGEGLTDTLLDIAIIAKLVIIEVERLRLPPSFQSLIETKV